MDRRFASVFDAIADERAKGKPFLEVLHASPNDELVAALAVAGGRDPVAANAIASELLNRLRRAPFLGAAVVSATTIVLVYGLDYAYTGSFLLLDAGPRASILVAATSFMLVVSLMLLLMWRGYFRGLRMRILAYGKSY